MSKKNKQKQGAAQVQPVPVMATTQVAPTQPAQTKQTVSIPRRVAVALGCSIAAVAISIGAAVAIVHNQSVERDVTTTEALEEVRAIHNHTFQPDTQLIHHDAVTRTVEHPAVYETVLVNHTVCNTCNEVLDGATDEHIEATGHEGYTPGVPVPEQHLVSAAWTETITDAAAYDELVTATETCAECGLTRAVTSND